METPKFKNMEFRKKIKPYLDQLNDAVNPFPLEDEEVLEVSYMIEMEVGLMLNDFIQPFKETIEELIEQNEQLKHRIPRSVEDDLRRKIERYETALKYILKCYDLGTITDFAETALRG
jgi:hypothetical protein